MVNPPGAGHDSRVSYPPSSWSGLGLSVVFIAALGCGGAREPAQSAAAQQAATIQARLHAGPWRLVDYRPDVTLEPMLQALLTAQLRTMVVRFEGGSLNAQSPTLQVMRPYALEDVAGAAFTLASPDIQGGGTMRSRCEVSEDGRRLTFRSETDPWTGTGALERE